jgi:hypothetical protein
VSKFPDEPGVYWAATQGNHEWNAIAHLTGKAPFMTLRVLPFAGVPESVQGYMPWIAEYVVVGPKLVAPESKPEVPPDWDHGYVERRYKHRSATEAASSN